VSSFWSREISHHFSEKIFWVILLIVNCLWAKWDKKYPIFIPLWYQGIFWLTIISAGSNQLAIKNIPFFRKKIFFGVGVSNQVLKAFRGYKTSAFLPVLFRSGSFGSPENGLQVGQIILFFV